jgi:hypothetical protein
MTADISRDTFDARKRYAGVVMQQGRVQLDADWNEQQSILRHHAETQGIDIIGASGAPVRDAGFRLTTDGAKVRIGAGRYYVGGILCENPVEIDYLNQADYPGAPDLASLFASAGATSAIFYLEAWRRPVTGLEDPDIREVALGGADTAIRLKTIWQVKILPVKPAATAPRSTSEWDQLITPATGRMSARAEPSLSGDNPCLTPPAAGYQRLENQLYRIEIHRGGDRNSATLKWSRDNGSVVTAIENFNGQQLTVHDLGRDTALGFANGQIVELVSDAVELTNQPGQLLRIDHVEEASRLVALTTAPSPINAALHPKLRRWDSGEVALSSASTADGWIELEDGVQVKFEAGTYKSGDYWLVPARALTGQLDWPFVTPQPSRNRPHAFCKLALGTLTRNVLSLQDSRMLFTPIAESPPAMHVTGVNWVHDDIIALEPLQSAGLQIFFDGAMTAPVGDSGQSIVSVTLETPAPLKIINPGADAKSTFRLSTPLAGEVTLPAPNVLAWKPAQSGAELSNLVAFLVNENIQRVRLRVILRGSMIWSEQSDQRLYVDGRVYGKSGFRADGSPRIDLSLPSGDGVKSSDFESWLYLQLRIPPPKLTQLALSSVLANPGDQITGTVVIDRPAQTPFTIALTVSGDGARVPASVDIPVGQTRANFTVTAATPASTMRIVVSGAASGVTLQETMTVQVINIAVTPAEVTIFVGGSQQFSAQESGGASAAGVTWSVQGPAGASVSQSGLFTSSVAGDFQVIATSNADRTRNKVAIAHVRQKSKDTKETKEKDNDKAFEKAIEKMIEKGAEKTIEKTRDKVTEKTREKIREKLAEKIPDLLISDLSLPALASEATDEQALVLPDVEAIVAAGRSFIRPAERPDLSRPPA